MRPVGESGAVEAIRYIAARIADQGPQVLVSLVRSSDVVPEIRLIPGVEMVIDSHQPLVLIGLKRENAAVALEHLYRSRRAGESRAKLAGGIRRQPGQDRLLGRGRLEDGQIREHRNGVGLAPP